VAYTTTMQRDDKARSGTALGGIGAGWFELGKDGIFHNWNIFNNRPHGTGGPFTMAHENMLFFIVRYEVEGERPQMKLMQIDEGHMVAAILDHYYAFPWLTGVDRIDYEATFPFVRMRFTDAEMPLEIELEAFSPFIPHDVKNSALPAALFDFTVRSKTRKPVDVMLMASMHNGVGYDVEDKFHVTSVRRRRGYRLFELAEGGMDELHSSYGSQALASLAADSTHYVGWEAPHPYYEIVIRSRELPDTDDTEGRNKVHPKTGKLNAMYGLYGTIAVSRRLKARGSFGHGFVMGWHFPNLYNRARTRVEGHYYANFFRSATDVVDYVVREREALRARSLQFTDDFFSSSAPRFVLEQVNSQLNTFFTSSWLTKDMNFGIQEGMSPDKEYGPLATIDVSMYGAMSVAALFPQLHQNMMRAHMRLQAPSGEIGHGINRDFEQTDVHEAVTGRLDLPSQYTLLTLLGYFWTGDRAYLKEVWPSVKGALDYVLRERDANGDCLPDMAGAMCTYDNFAMFGAASYTSSLWLGALRMAVEAAGVLRDAEAAQRYRDVLAKAGASFEQKLWNGSYYRLYNDAGGDRGDLDEGCLTDQAIGQWACRLAGLGDIVPRAHLQKALRTICRISRQPWGLVNCRWRDDGFLHPVPMSCWHDQANTCWSGVELAFASFLIYEGMYRQGLGVIENVDTRYRKAGMYFDHIEFGGHYYRPMSAWAIVNALLGLTVNDGAYAFEPRVPGDEVRLFFSFGGGTAHYERRVAPEAERIALRVRTGTLKARSVQFALARKDGAKASVKGAAGATAEVAGGRLTVAFPKGLSLGAGEALDVTVRRTEAAG
jgi:non-lysosomal glucosylceramidase